MTSVVIWHITLLVPAIIIIVYLTYKHQKLHHRYEQLDKALSEQQVPQPLEVTEPQPLSEFDRSFLERLDAAIADQMVRGDVKVEKLADQMCLSRSQLNRRVKALTGVSTICYSNQIRMNKACRMFQSDPNTTVSEIAQQCGFEDASYFTRAFKRFTGMAPGAYRKQFLNNKNDRSNVEEVL